MGNNAVQAQTGVSSNSVKQPVNQPLGTTSPPLPKPKHFLTLLTSKKIILAISIVIIVAIIAGVVAIFLLKRVPNTPSVNFEEIDFPSRVWKDRILNNVAIASKEKDKNKRLELYQNIFRDLQAIYQRDHNSKTRNQTETLAQFIAKEFPDSYNPKNFTIPCLDLACGSPNYPTDIEEIKSKLKGISSLEPLMLNSVLKKFEAAALSNDPNYQWQNYLGAFQEIKSEKLRTKDEKINQVALSLRDFLKSKFPEIYSQWEQKMPDVLDI